MMRPEDLNQTASHVRECMARLGVHLQQEWIAHCLGDGNIDSGSNVDSALRVSNEQATEKVYQTFLSCDLREAGTACIPAGVGDMVKERIRGKMVVQVEESRDVAKSFEQRERSDGGSSHHTLKLALGDGTQTVAALEYRRIQGLSADPPPGLKLLLFEPWVRRGILLLSSDNTTVLGGEVSSLIERREEARSGGKEKNATVTAPNVESGSSQSGNTAQTQTHPNGSSSAGANDTQLVNSNNDTNGGLGQKREPLTEQSGQAPARGNSRRVLEPPDSRAEVHPTVRVERSRQGMTAARATNGLGATREAAQAPSTGVFNPYSTMRRSAQSAPTGASTGNEEKQVEVRGPAYAFCDDDDGPNFEYFEEPDADEPDFEEPDMDDVIRAMEPRQRLPHRDAASSTVAKVLDLGSTVPALPTPLEASPPVTPRVTSRPKIVTAREQSETLKAEEIRRAREGKSGGDGEMDGDVVGGCGDGSEREGDGSRRKRGRSEIPAESGRDENRPCSPPRGPYAVVADLEGLSSTAGVYRVKAVVSDIKCCKIRKKKYCLVICVEDGTGVMAVRLSDAMTRSIFGCDAKEFKKVAKADPDRATVIQNDAEGDIRELEGVMEIDFTPAAATQSPPAPETPGGLMSQGSASGEPEWSLPEVLSVTPPSVVDCHDLLARVQSLL